MALSVLSTPPRRTPAEVAEQWQGRLQYYKKELSHVVTPSPGQSPEDRVTTLSRRLERDYSNLCANRGPLTDAFIPCFSHTRVEVLWIRHVLDYRRAKNGLWDLGDASLQDRVSLLELEVSSIREGLATGNPKIRRSFESVFKDFHTELKWHRQLISYRSELQAIRKEVDGVMDDMSIDLVALKDRIDSLVQNLTTDIKLLEGKPGACVVLDSLKDLLDNAQILIDPVESHELDEGGLGESADSFF